MSDDKPLAPSEESDSLFEGYGGHIKKEPIQDLIPLQPFKLPFEYDPDFFEFSDPHSAIGGTTNYSWARLAVTDSSGKIRHFVTKMALVSNMLKWFADEGMTLLKMRVKGREYETLDEVQALAAKFEGQPA